MVKWEEELAQTGQGILDARQPFLDAGWSLADLYDPEKMPETLREAHRKNDAAVLRAYGLPEDATEEEVVAHLMKLYQKLTTEPENKMAIMS